MGTVPMLAASMFMSGGGILFRLKVNLQELFAGSHHEMIFYYINI